MAMQRVSLLERGPDGLYRYLIASEDMRQALFDYLACDGWRQHGAERGLPRTRTWRGCSSRNGGTDGEGLDD